MNYEADVLGEMHEILFKNGYLDKMLDILTFFNFKRDCNITLETTMGILFD